MRKGFFFLFLIFLGACTPTNIINLISTSTNPPTSNGTNYIVTTSPTIKPSENPTTVVTKTALPNYLVIDEKNIGDLGLLHNWEVEDVGHRSNAFWFLDSRQFIIPTASGIQAYNVTDFSPAWFIQTVTLDAVIVDQDRVITFLPGSGLLVFNDHGKKIRTIKVAQKDDCNEAISTYIVAIPRTNLIISGHYHYGDITDSYGSSRLLVWDKKDDSCKSLDGEFVGRITSLTASYDGHYISYSVITSTVDTASGEWVAGGTTHIFDMKDRKETCHLGAFIAEFNQQNQLANYDNKQGVISLVTPSDCAAQTEFKVGRDLIVLTFNPTGDILAGSSGLTVEFWSTKSGKKIGEIDLEASLINWPLLGFSPDGRFLVTTKIKTSPTEKDQVMLWGIPGK